MSPEKLAYMVNQIARFFAHEPEAKAVADTTDHLRRFWEPRMRRAIIDYVEAGGAGLQPIALQAIQALRTPAPAR
jgi:formate dehydrogenase subunit delta